MITLIAVWALLPNMTHPLDDKNQRPQTGVSLLNLLGNPRVIYAFMSMGLAIFSTFLIVPNLATWLQYSTAIFVLIA
ncbi:hypothetical protein ROSI111154_10105 [Rouxiella silvae]